MTSLIKDMITDTADYIAVVTLKGDNSLADLRARCKDAGVDSRVVVCRSFCPASCAFFLELSLSRDDAIEKKREDTFEQITYGERKQVLIAILKF